ncbi:MAG: uncharacterized protein KVP18_003356 [Porospora cf. gigantea A]|uniref:uncharacterized protein n=2 Tax=Porospora cf. gigantea A TaxID=2853593 RepID=UPI0035598E21|nr:MAG: hypothetical protein KVP18_003356 [Porospora cf. gigantea A]
MPRHRHTFRGRFSSKTYEIGGVVSVDAGSATPIRVEGSDVPEMIGVMGPRDMAALRVILRMWQEHARVGQLCDSPIPLDNVFTQRSHPFELSVCDHLSSVEARQFLTRFLSTLRPQLDENHRLYRYSLGAPMLPFHFVEAILHPSHIGPALEILADCGPSLTWNERGCLALAALMDCKSNLPCASWFIPLCYNGVCATNNSQSPDAVFERFLSSLQEDGEIHPLCVTHLKPVTTLVDAKLLRHLQRELL